MNTPKIVFDGSQWVEIGVETPTPRIVFDEHDSPTTVNKKFKTLAEFQEYLDKLENEERIRKQKSQNKRSTK